MSKKTGGVMGVFTDEHTILEAAEKTRLKGFKDFDAITPYPIHGMEEAVGVKRSWIPWVTLAAGAFGCFFGLWFTWWTSAVSWPINVGGKPMWSLPAFIPIIFELTILFAALASVKVMILGALGLPKVNPPVVDLDLTSHKFGLFVSENDKNYSSTEVQAWMKELGAEAVYEVSEY
jgi:hypothetical protein